MVRKRNSILANNTVVTDFDARDRDRGHLSENRYSMRRDTRQMTDKRNASKSIDKNKLTATADAIEEEEASSTVHHPAIDPLHALSHPRLRNAEGNIQVLQQLRKGGDKEEDNDPIAPITATAGTGVAPQISPQDHRMFNHKKPKQQPPQRTNTKPLHPSSSKLTPMLLNSLSTIMRHQQQQSLGDIDFLSPIAPPSKIASSINRLLFKSSK